MSFDKINETYAGLSDAVKKEYLGAAQVLPFTALEIKANFSPEEIVQVNAFLAEMKAAAGDNEKKAKAITKAVDVVGKLLQLAKVAV